jgi:regulatory protein
MAEQDAVETALRALRFRDRSAAELRERLAEQGLGEAEQEQALETLARSGYLDDERFARGRAEQLAGRGAGDALIRHDLAGRGLDAEHVEAALAALEPEAERAARIVAKRGAGPKTARYLASKGFGEAGLAVAVAETD